MKLLFFDFNILNIINNRQVGVGGATIQAYNWIQGLLANGIDIGIIVEDVCDDTSKALNIDFIKSYNNKVGVFPLNWIYYRYGSLKKAIKNYRPDYVYQAGAGFITFVLSRICKKLNIHFIHRIANDVDVDKRIKSRLSPLKWILYNNGLNNSTIILCQNNYQLNCISKRFPKKKILKIHNPYKFDNISYKIKSLSQRKYVAWLGIFQYQKNLPVLLKIVKKLSHVQFHIGGIPSSNIDKATLNTIKLLRSCKNVTFIGFVKRSEIGQFLGKAYALLNTSYYEGFSNTFLESFAAGTPVITVSNVDPDQIIEKNGLGLIGNDYNDLPNLISKIIKYDQYDVLCSKCVDYIRDNHNSEVLSKKLLEFLKNNN